MAVAKRTRKSALEKFFIEGTDEIPVVGVELRYAINLVRQGNHRFYTLTIPSHILSACSFATTKDENAQLGFQRVLDNKRAQDIANYVDAGGTILNRPGFRGGQLV
jgi:hypothetical protein